MHFTRGSTREHGAVAGQRGGHARKQARSQTANQAGRQRKESGPQRDAERATPPIGVVSAPPVRCPSSTSCWAPLLIEMASRRPLPGTSRPLGPCPSTAEKAAGRESCQGACASRTRHEGRSLPCGSQSVRVLGPPHLCPQRCGFWLVILLRTKRHETLAAKQRRVPPPCASASHTSRSGAQDGVCARSTRSSEMPLFLPRPRLAAPCPCSSSFRTTRLGHRPRPPPPADDVRSIRPQRELVNDIEAAAISCTT